MPVLLSHRGIVLPRINPLSGIGVNPESLLSISNRSLTEGDSGSTNMTFTLSRGLDHYPVIRFRYGTENGTATAGVDYTATSGDGTIAPGQSFQINVPILGDVDDESDETFTLRISNIAWA